MDDFTKKMVQDHMLVARTITQVNMIEQIIDAYIAEFYTRCPAAGYQQPYLALIRDVLHNKGVTLNTKVEILFKIFKRTDPKRITQGSKKDFQDWMRIRNIFAHGVYVSDDGGGKIHLAGEAYVSNDQVEIFMELQQKIHMQLERFSELRGAYFSDMPTAEWGEKK